MEGSYTENMAYLSEILPRMLLIVAIAGWFPPKSVEAAGMELFLKPETNTVSVRSASRSGYYDFGVNRKRVENLRQDLLAADLIEL